jgi:hypothetical protein
MRRLSYANVMSTIAVFVALGGAAYAVVALPANSVGTRQVKNRSLGVVDLSRGAVRSLHGKAGSAGARSATGPTGATGAPGTAGLNGAKGDTGDVARWSSSLVPNEEIVSTPVSLAFADGTVTGPSVTLTVPASGLVELYASVHIQNDPNGYGSVGLNVDNAPYPITNCGLDTLLMLSVPNGNSDYAASGNGSCGVRLPATTTPTFVTTTPGTHTFKLVYAVTRNSGTTTVHFSDRRLFVAPRP